MTQETLGLKPAGLTTVPCTLCGQPSLVATMTTDGDGRYYCGRYGTAGYGETIAECDQRQRHLAERRARVNEVMAAADEVAPAGDVPGNSPATETVNEPATETPAEAPAAEPAEVAHDAPAGDAA